MKIKLYNDKNNKEEKTNDTNFNKEKTLEQPKYIIKGKKERTFNFGYLLINLLAGVIGGAITIIVFTYLNIDTTNKMSTSSKSLDSITSYNFSTVENPAVAIAETVSKSVVGIKTTYKKSTMFGNINDLTGEGSGIVYSKDGYIITNYHVIKEALSNSTAKVYVMFTDDKTEYEAQIIGSDEVTDLAVIKINKTDLKVAEFGDSDSVKVGDIAIAIGNPLGEELAGTLTGGYISAINRTITTEGRNYKLIQTDAAINTGNSGGALVNSSGKIIGINTAKIVATGVEGIGFAIPINDTLDVIEELIKSGKILRPYIGIGGIAITESEAKMYGLVEGVYIQQVYPSSPAAISGIKQGDVITKVDSKEVGTVDNINEIKNKKKKGDNLIITIYRDGEYKDIKVVLAEH